MLKRVWSLIKLSNKITWGKEMAGYKCNSCDKEVMYKSRGFIFFLFWPWTMLFMKKRCPICGTEVQKN